jgi:hypothetical protein
LERRNAVSTDDNLERARAWFAEHADGEGPSYGDLADLLDDVRAEGELAERRRESPVPAQALAALVKDGGALVSSNECTPGEITFARAEERFFVTADGFGFVRRPVGWLRRERATDSTKGQRIIEAAREAVRAWERSNASLSSSFTVAMQTLKIATTEES